QLVIDLVPVDLLLGPLEEAVQGNLDEQDHLSHRGFSLLDPCFSNCRADILHGGAHAVEVRPEGKHADAAKETPVGHGPREVDAPPGVDPAATAQARPPL